MFGEGAIKLVRELKRFPDPAMFPPHSVDLVRSVQREMKHLFSESAAILERNSQRMAEQAELFDDAGGDSDGIQLPAKELLLLSVAQTTIRRDKQCLLTYHYHRMERLKRLVWEMRAEGAGNRPPPKDLRPNLAPSEQIFYQEYASLVSQYKQLFEDVVDITGPCLPPTQFYVKVRALKDLEFIDDQGVARSMAAGQQDYLRRSAVERFIEQGYLIHIA